MGERRGKGIFWQIIEKQRLNKIETLPSAFWAGHCKLTMRLCKLTMEHCNLAMRLCSLEMEHCKSAMELRNLEKWLCKPAMGLGKLARELCRFAKPAGNLAGKRCQPASQRFNPAPRRRGVVSSPDRFIGLLPSMNFIIYFRLFYIIRLQLFRGLCQSRYRPRKTKSRRSDHGQRTEIWSRLERD